MGLMDIVNGVLNGPRGQRQPSTREGGGGMSPMMMALLGLLAYKALKGRGGSGHPAAPQQPGSGTRTASQLPGGTATAGTSPGGLGSILGGLLGGRASGATTGAGLQDLMKGGLGGLLAGATAGSVVSGGLGNLMKEFQDRGYGNVAQSWIGTGPNQAITPHDLESALGGETLDTIAQQAGMSRSELLSGLSNHLPELVDQLTPDGRVPSEEEASRIV
jgi:uncharacterized protein YidB (DUF937 family)